jgi:hypothetical protein
MPSKKYRIEEADEDRDFPLSQIHTLKIPAYTNGIELQSTSEGDIAVYYQKFGLDEEKPQAGLGYQYLPPDLIDIIQEELEELEIKQEDEETASVQKDEQTN